MKLNHSPTFRAFTGLVFLFGLIFCFTFFSHGTALAAKKKTPPKSATAPAAKPESLYPYQQYARGNKVEVFPAKDINGKPVDMSKHIGRKTVVLAFWLNTCDLCIQELKILDTALKDPSLKKNVSVFTVTQARTKYERENVLRMYAAAKLKFPILLDRDRAIARTFTISMVPSFVIIAPDRTLITPAIFHIRRAVRDMTFEDCLKLTADGKECPAVQFLPRNAEKVVNDLIGKKPPDFTLKDLKDNTYTLSGDLGKKPIMLVFWHPGCKDCDKTMPYLEDHIRNLSKIYDFTVLSLAYLYGENQKKEANEFVVRYGLTFPVLIDRDGLAGKAFKIEDIPCFVFIDRKGNVAEILVNMHGPLYDVLESVLKSMN